MNNTVIVDGVILSIYGVIIVILIYVSVRFWLLQRQIVAEAYVPLV